MKNRPVILLKLSSKMLLLLILLTLVMTACGEDARPSQISPSSASEPTLVPTIPSIPPTIQASPDDWEYSWLKGTPCRAPCWQNITPGRTNFDDALKILHQLPFVQDLSIAKYSPSIEWRWPTPNKGLARLTYDKTDIKKTVTSLELPFPKTFKLRDINQIYGEPTYAWAGVQLTYYVYILYLDQGILLYNQFQTKPSLDEATSFSGIIFTRSYKNIEEYIKNWDYSDVPSNIPRWQGYTGFNYYCVGTMGCPG